MATTFERDEDIHCPNCLASFTLARVSKHRWQGVFVCPFCLQPLRLIETGVATATTEEE